MTATVTRTGARTSAPGSSGPRTRRRGPLAWLRRHIVQIVAALVLAYMFAPIAVVVLLSFNAPAGRYNYDFNQFTLDNWLRPCGAQGLCESLQLSLTIAGLATLGSTVLGTLTAFALARHHFRGRGATNLLVFLPMATPEVVMGSSLLTLFVNTAVLPLGFWTILVAHIMFCLSFVVVTVKSRLAGLDPRLVEAAGDLYASPRVAFVKVTLPLAMPGIVSAAMLAFALSIDDFIVTNFNSGNEVTFPMFVWGSAQRGVPAQVNVIGTAMFVIALLIVLSGDLVRRRRTR